MTASDEHRAKPDRQIALRILAGLFLFGAVKNASDLIIADYEQESLLWIRYIGLAISSIGLLLLYRWGYVLFIVVVAFSLIVFHFLSADGPNAAQIAVGLIGPVIISIFVLRKWSTLK